MKIIGMKSLIVLVALVMLSRTELFHKVLKSETVSLSSSNKHTGTITDVNDKVPLLIILRDIKQRENWNALASPVTITLISKEGTDTASVVCKHTTYKNICIIEDTAESVSFELSAAGSVDFVMLIEQREPTLFDGDQIRQEESYQTGLFKLKRSSSHSLLVITCVNSEVGHLEQELQMYSNAQLIQIYGYKQHPKKIQNQMDALVGIKKIEKETEQYIYIEIQTKNYKTLKNYLHIVYENSRDRIQPSSLIRDFVDIGDPDPVYDYIDPTNADTPINSDLKISCHVTQPKSQRKVALNLAVVGYLADSNTQQEIAKAEIANLSFNKYSRHFDFTYHIAASVAKDYKNIKVLLQFVYTTKGYQKEERNSNIAVFTLEFAEVEEHKLDRYAPLYITAEKDSSMKFIVEGTELTASNADDLVKIIPSDEALATDPKKCYLSKECAFSIKALKYCKGCSVSFKSHLLNGPKDISYLTVQKDRLKGRISLQQNAFFKFIVGAEKSVEVITNTPNIIMYIYLNSSSSSKTKCQYPSESCNTQVCNEQHPAVFNNPTTKEMEILINIEGLDETLYDIMFVDFNKEIEIMDGVSFAYPISASKGDITLSFIVPHFKEEEDYPYDISINLVAPMKSLTLRLYSAEKEPKEIGSTIQGYLRIKAKQVKNSQYWIKINKNKVFKNQEVHFTVLASTSAHKLRLDSGITHYTTFAKAEIKKYLIEFDSNQNYGLNFHMYNNMAENPKIKAQLRAIRSDMNPHSKKVTEDSQEAITDFIDNDVVEIKFDGSLIYFDLDEDEIERRMCQFDHCQLELSMENLEGSAVEMSITLITAHAVLELKDGLWETFQLNPTTKGMHFYFFPRHNDKPIHVIYSTSDSSVQMTYDVKSTKDNINPTEWNFPNRIRASDMNDHDSFMDENSEITINQNGEIMKNCWPDCVLLLTVDFVEDSETPEKPIKFNVMASNNLLQLQEKVKLQISLNKGEQQLVFVDLKTHIQKKQLTFFTYYTIGYCDIYASFSFSESENLPTAEKHEIKFNSLETAINLDKFIQESLRNGNEMIEEKSYYISLLIVASEKTKMSMHFISDNTVRTLSLNSYESIDMKAQQWKVFKFMPFREYKLVLLRTQGYIEVKFLNCKTTNIQQCFDQGQKAFNEEIKKDKDKDKDKDNLQKEEKKRIETEENHFSSGNMFQIISRREEHFGKQCLNCVSFIWIYCEDDQASVTLQLRPTKAEIELQEHAIVKDYVETKNINRYVITASRSEVTTITIEIEEGKPLIEVQDHYGIEEKKTSKDMKNKIISIVLPAHDVDDKEQASVKEHENTYSSIFEFIHLQVQPEDEKPLSYSVSYSSGQKKLYLMDGSIVQRQIRKDETITIYYKSRKNQNSHIYMAITSQDNMNELERVQKNIELDILCYNSVNDKKYAKQIKPQTPPLKLHAKTSQIYELPPVYQLIQVRITSSADLYLTISINHKQIMFLPLYYEFPLKLHQGEELEFVVEKMENSAIEVIVKKCDESLPKLYYTNNEEEFKDNKFSYADVIQGMQHSQTVNTKEDGRAYLKLEAQKEQETRCTIQIKYALETQDLLGKADPGNNGQIQFNYINAETIEIKVDVIECSPTPCTLETKYHLYASTSENRIKEEISCPNNIFQENSNNLVQMEVVRQPNSISKTIEFKLTVPQSSYYVSIVAYSQDIMHKVPYQTIRVNSFMSSLEKLPLKLTISVSLLLLTILFLVFQGTKSWARQGYRQISDDDR